MQHEQSIVSRLRDLRHASEASPYSGVRLRMYFTLQCCQVLSHSMLFYLQLGQEPNLKSYPYAISPANDPLAITITPSLLLFSQPTCSSPYRRMARLLFSTLPKCQPILLAPKVMRCDLRNLRDLLAFDVNRRFLL